MMGLYWEIWDFTLWLHRYVSQQTLYEVWESSIQVAPIIWSILDLPSMFYISIHFRVYQFIHKIMTEWKNAQLEEVLRNAFEVSEVSMVKDSPLSPVRKQVMTDTCRSDQLLSAATREEPGYERQKYLRNSSLYLQIEMDSWSWKYLTKPSQPQFQVRDQSLKGRADPGK